VYNRSDRLPLLFFRHLTYVRLRFDAFFRSSMLVLSLDF
jgi:hypothetical protein